MISLTRSLLLNLLLICLTLVVLELGFRGIRRLLRGPDCTLTAYHPVLGWDVIPNARLNKWARDASGRPYRVDYATDHLGFRMCATTQPDRPKIMFLGDSFTHAAAVSNCKTYYGILARAFPEWDFFGYGCGGWGTLQELLKLYEVLRIIQPHSVVIQLCSNDFINNHCELERVSNWHNNGTRRPYLTMDGNLVYLTPTPWPALRDIINQHSRLLYWGISRWNRLMVGERGGVEQDIEARGAGHEGFSHALSITQDLMARIRIAAGGAKVLAFSADERQPYTDAFKTICDRVGISFIEGVPQRISAAAQGGDCVCAADEGHWNETGHALCAEVLIRYFTETAPQLAPRQSKTRMESVADETKD